MASSLSPRNDHATCSKCHERFHELYNLPCGHYCCLGCLERITDGDSFLSTESGANICMYCGSHNLPCDPSEVWNNRDTKELHAAVGAEATTTVEESHIPENTGETLTLCYLCDDHSRAEAVKHCAACCFWYCEDCLTELHPMRGALKDHILLSTEEFLAITGGRVPLSASVKSNPPCDVHKQLYSIFCVTCQTVICNGCLVDHNEHTMSDIESASKKLKEQFIQDTKQCEEAQLRLKKSISALEKLEKDIQKHEGLQETEILKAYDKALEALEKWKNDALKDLEKGYLDWYKNCKAAITDLKINSDELEKKLEATRDSTASTHVEFLQRSQYLRDSAYSNLSEIEECLKTNEDVRSKVTSDVDLRPVVSRTLSITDKLDTPVKKPVLKFTTTNHPQLKISDNGRLIKGSNFKKNVGYIALTDGCFQSGQVSWGVEITVCPTKGTSQFEGHCRSILLRGPGLSLTDADAVIRWIGIQYSDSDVSFFDPTNRSYVAKGYKRSIAHRGPYLLGFNLNCDLKTLLVIDCYHNQVVAIIKDIDLSEPVVPAVEFCLTHGQAIVSARIVPWDGSLIN